MPTTTAQRSAATGPCGEYAGFAPAFYANPSNASPPIPVNALPPIPVKTVRLIFHVMQKNDGTENWQSPAQDGGLDETILRGYINGVTWPLAGQPGSAPARGANELFRQLDNRQTVPPAGVPWPATYTPAPAPLNDTRIQFRIMAVRYYRDNNGWDMSNQSATGCQALGCFSLYDRYVTNSAANPGNNGQPAPNQQVAIDPGDRDNAVHVFFGENPGTPGTPIDQFGNLVSRYGTGGAAGGKAIIPVAKSFAKSTANKC